MPRNWRYSAVPIDNGVAGRRRGMSRFARCGLVLVLCALAGVTSSHDHTQVIVTPDGVIGEQAYRFFVKVTSLDCQMCSCCRSRVSLQKPQFRRL
jgi:hypothetical protein